MIRSSKTYSIYGYSSKHGNDLCTDTVTCFVVLVGGLASYPAVTLVCFLLVFHSLCFGPMETGHNFNQTPKRQNPGLDRV